MVTKQDILGYVSFTPYNTNVNVLGPMLDEFGSESPREENELIITIRNTVDNINFEVITGMNSDMDSLNISTCNVSSSTTLRVKRYEDYNFEFVLRGNSGLSIQNKPADVTFEAYASNNNYYKLTVPKTYSQITLIIMGAK